MSQKQERELCAEVRICSSSAILAVVQVVSSWSNIPCLLVGKASAPKEIPFSQIANIISKGEKKLEKNAFFFIFFSSDRRRKTQERENMKIRVNPALGFPRILHYCCFCLKIL